MRKFLFVLPLAALLFSCAKEPAETGGGDFLLTVSMPSEGTKTTLGAKTSGAYPVLWQEGDCITVNGVASRPLTAAEAGGKSAVFRFSESIKAPYHARYGAEVPSVQLYNEGNIRSGYAPMSAVSYDPSFTLEHNACILSLPLSGSVTVAGISVSSLDGEALGEGGDVLMRMPSGGVGVSSAKTFCLVLSPGSGSKGIVVEIVTTQGKRMVLTTLVGERLTAGKVYELSSTEFAANAESLTVISDYAGLKAFASRVAASDKYIEARLAADITVDNTWTPLEGFTGDLDGGGHTVSGLSKAFANELRGCIRNLSVDGAIIIASKDDIVGDESVNWAGILANRVYEGGSLVNCVTTGSITYNQWGKAVYAGSLCGYAPRGIFRYCVNKASVSVTGDGSAVIYAGGVIGYTYASSNEIIIDNCRNEAPVTVGGSVKGAAIGGIVGRMGASHTSTMTRDVNTGTVLLDASATVSAEVSLGGIAGYSLNRFADCLNEGMVHQGAAMTSPQNVGGIAGQVITDSVSGCVQSGRILLDAASAGVIRCGGVLGYALSDASVSSISLNDCSFGGEIHLDIASHSSLYAEPLTGLYNIAAHTETNCSSTGSVTVK